MKKRILAIIMSLVLMIGILPVTALAADENTLSDDFTAGIFWYDFSDGHLSRVRSALDDELDALGVDYIHYDAAGTQAVQNDQIDTAIAQGAKLLVVNIVDTAAIDAAQAIVDKAARAKIPVIFFNREVDDDVLNTYENACFVGTRVGDAGEKQGIMAGNYIVENYDKVDLNDDGRISYIMMKGELGNPHAEARTILSVEYANAILNKAGKQPLKYYDRHNLDFFQPSNWSKVAAFELMETALSTNPMDGKEPIEVVFANNDRAAIGCVEALNNAGWNTGEGNSIPVFGVDGTMEAAEAIQDGRMTGTILESAANMAETVAVCVNNAANGKNVFDGADDLFEVDESAAKIRVPYETVTAENLSDYDDWYDDSWYDDNWYDDYESASGVCGDNLTWVLEDYVLTISGEGPMWDFDDYDNLPGWTYYGFNTVVIEEGVTSIGDYVFAECYSIDDVFIPASVSNIGDKAFAGHVLIYNGIWVDEANRNYSNDENGVLYNKDKTELICVPRSIYDIFTIPESVERIANYAFLPEWALDIVVFEGDAPEFGEWAFNGLSAAIFYPENNDTWTEEVMQDYGGMVAWQLYDPENPDFTIYGECGDNLTWSLDADGILLISGEGEMWNYNNEWPSWIGFADTIYDVVIEEGVTSIGAYAFEGLMYIDLLTIPASVKSIGACAFKDIQIAKGFYVDEDNKYFCTDKYGVLFDKDMEVLIKAPYLWKGIYEIPEGVLSISDYAFADTNNEMYQIVFPESLTHIGMNAFWNFGFNSTVKIPAGVTVIDEHAFSGSYGIDAFVVDEENEFYSNDENGVLFNKDKTELIKIPDYLSGTYVIPNGVETIADMAFVGGYELSGIEIPNTVTYIGDSAFGGCWEITSITLPESVRFVSDYAFKGCDNLTTITVKGDNTTFSEYAFEWCWGLSKIIFEGNAPRIFGFDFYWPEVRVYYPEGNATWTQEFMEEYYGWAVFIEYDPNEPIPTDIIAKGECGDELTWVLSEYGLLTISGKGEMWDFDTYNDFPAPWGKYSNWINDILITNGVTSIGDEAFEYCWNVEYISIPDTVTSIGYYAICCDNLAELYIPDSVIYIGPGNFSSCSSLTAIWVDNNNPNYCSDDNGVLFNKDKTELIKVPSTFVGEYVVPQSVKYINSVAFDNCEYINEIMIHANVEIIDCAFQFCYELTAIVVDEDNKNYSSDESGALLNKDMTELLIVPRGIEGQYVIPDGVISIASWAINGFEKLTSLVIPASVKNIEETAIVNSDVLMEIIVDEENKYFSNDEQGALFNKDKTELMLVPSGIEGGYTIPASVTSITAVALDNIPYIDTLIFEGNAPNFAGSLWREFTVLYPENNPTWTEEVMASFGEDVTWIPYTPSARPQGDVNGDGEITNADLIMVARYIVELYSPETVNAIKQYGDMDGDGNITNADLISIARIIVGL